MGTRNAKHHMILIKILIFFGSSIVCTIFFTQNAKATNQYYVSSSTGSDSNPGTIDAPWKTMQKAADTAIAGDTVNVRSGSYGRTIFKHSGTTDNYITFKAYTGEKPLLTGTAWVGFDGYSVSNLEYIVVDGFEVTGFGEGILFKYSKNIIVRNNYVHDTTKFGIDIGRCDTVEVYNNTVANVAEYSGIWGSYGNNYKFHHNEAYGNADNGIGISYGTTNSQIYNNVAHHNSCGADQRYAGIAIEVSSTNNKVYNNVIYKNCRAGYISNSSNNYIYNNTLYSNGTYEWYL